ncbi:hypothetical protein [Flavimaricola marinus]|uniref:DUF1127 domain-containing protein n=1 Tax=Flavimaricola marinus TaxID=1819565 RepID=A0A238LE23_9RHOB|nr:hypothetical protein [Flavimaricola marinus]SMY07929.1 hypothetical protein LOM8899_02074 [Flavimaricola marinus]
MITLETLRTRIAQRRAYKRTRDELAKLPIDIALDLNIYHGDADTIARKAVYG